MTKAELDQQLKERDAQLARALAVIEQQKIEMRLMREQVDTLLRRLFGKKSEVLPEGQMVLDIPGVEVVEAPQLPAPKRQERKGRVRAVRRLDDLPVEEEEVLEPDEVKSSPQDWKRIGAEETHRVEVIPSRIYLKRIVRPKYVHRSDRHRAPVIAPLPGGVRDRCMAGSSLMASIAVAKYVDHLPLYRQEQIFRTRHGVDIDRRRMAEWMSYVAEALEPIYREIRQGVFAGGYVQVDETMIKYLDPGNGATKHGFLWAASCPQGDVIFQWHPGRGAECLEKLIPKDYAGIIQCDGFAAYDCFGRKRKIQLIGCWAHVRRKFFEAQVYEKAKDILSRIQNLYRVEEEARGLEPEKRQALRASRSAPVVAEIKSLLEAWKDDYLPQSLMGKAIRYARNEWSGLEHYLADGRLEIDQNLVENAIRPTAVGKKNWLFVGGVESGWVGAVIYSVVESCRRRRLDPLAYLTEVLTKLPNTTTRTIHELTPEAYARKLQAAS